MPNGVVNVTVSQRDGFGKYCVSVNNGVLTVYHREDMVCMATNFILKTI